MTARWLVRCTTTSRCRSWPGRSRGSRSAPGSRRPARRPGAVPVRPRAADAPGRRRLAARRAAGCTARPAVLGALALLALFGLALELLRPAWAFAATLLRRRSACRFLYVARDAFSESLMLILLAAGAWMLLSALRAGSRRRAGLAGVLLGRLGVRARRLHGLRARARARRAVARARSAATASPARCWRSGGRRRRCSLGLVPGVAIGLLDLTRAQSAPTTAPQREPVLQLTAVTVVVVLVGVRARAPAAVARWLRALLGAAPRAASRPALRGWARARGRARRRAAARCGPPETPR